MARKRQRQGALQRRYGHATRTRSHGSESDDAAYSTKRIDRALVTAIRVSARRGADSEATLQDPTVERLMDAHDREVVALDREMQRVHAPTPRRRWWNRWGSGR